MKGPVAERSLSPTPPMVKPASVLLVLCELLSLPLPLSQLKYRLERKEIRNMLISCLGTASQRAHAVACRGRGRLSLPEQLR